MTPSTPAPPVLSMEGIGKSFSGVAVLRDMHLEVLRGEVHALMGENGAGKSTLMKILSGVVPGDAGEIHLDGKPVEIRSPREALQLGISMIHQELNPVRNMTVAENIFLGKEPCLRLTPLVDRKLQRELTLALFREMDVSIDPDRKIKALSVAEMQLVEMVKAISNDSRILIMDEPTSAISSREVAKLFDVIRALREKGVAIIYISHKMDEIFQISDTITVLRDGQFVLSRPAREMNHDSLVKAMVGREISQLFPARTASPGEVSLEVKGLTRQGSFDDVSFQSRRGEILGIAGLMGAGRTEVVETIFGLREADAGSVSIGEKAMNIRRPGDAIHHGLALITEDRQAQGLNLKASVRDNITLVDLKAYTRWGSFLDSEKENRAVDATIEKLRIKTSNRRQKVRNLSGGNQQKVVLGKWLLKDPSIIILDEPTRGVDIGAKAEIYKIIGDLAQAGKTIILISSELEEIIGLCDRAIVLAHGRIAAEFERSEFDREAIIRAALGNVAAKPGNH